MQLLAELDVPRDAEAKPGLLMLHHVPRLVEQLVNLRPKSTRAPLAAWG
ncbi:MAG TPA: hypothetical protein VHF51_10440 [Solirubrobacteraceae bacterium]|nr:hypothetical protein [Solirubrobacteraceae bacterium]